MAKKLEMLYDGKAKQIFATDDPKLAIIHYKDNTSAYNGLKTGMIEGKGIINNRVSNHLMKMLERHGIESHVVEQLSDRETLVRRVEIIPVELVVRNIAAGSLAKRIGYPEGTRLASTVVELCYKNEDLGDPMINHTHVYAMGLATPEEMKTMETMALRINQILSDYLHTLDIELVDCKMEFGRYEGRILLADEISPDSGRLWDIKTNEKLDKDRFRWDLGDVEEAYQEVLNRILESEKA